MQARAKTIDLAGVRTRAEAVMTHLWTRPPAAAARSRRGNEARRAALRPARAPAADRKRGARLLRGRALACDDGGSSQVYRSLGVAKYLCWELRDALANIEPVYAAAWRYESTESGLDHMLAHYRVAEDDAQRCADRIDGVMREDYLRNGTVPPWDEVMRSAR